MANQKISDLNTITPFSNTWFEISSNGATGKANAQSLSAIMGGGGGGGGSINAAISNATTSGITANLTAGVGLTFGQLCYVSSDTKLYPANADTTAYVSFMAAGTITINTLGPFLALGSANNYGTWNFTPGSQLFLSNNVLGGLTATAPAGSGDIVQAVGLALSSNVVYFRPSPDFVTHA